MRDRDRYFFERAVRLAYMGMGKTSPNPSVGCVIVKDGEIVGEGYHIYAHEDHAEVVALKMAGNRAKGSIMYVTLEPCFHHGRTPPCVDRIIETGIKRVVVGMMDPNPLVSGKSIEKLRKNGITVDVLGSHKRLESLNEDFFKFIVKKIPFVAIKVALTLDGKLATTSGNSKWITGDKARKYTHFLRYRYNSILVGVNTILKDNPLLTCRYKKKKGVPFYRFVIDPHLKIPASARIFSEGGEEQPIVIFTGGDVEHGEISKKCKIISIPQDGGRLDLYAILKEIAGLGVSSVLVEGGSFTISEFIKYGFVDKIHIFFAPKLLGDGISFYNAKKDILKMEDALKLKFICSKNFGEDVLLNYYFNHRRGG